MLMLDLSALEVQSFPTTVGEAVDATLPFESTKGPMCTCVSCTSPPSCPASWEDVCYTQNPAYCPVDATKGC